MSNLWIRDLDRVTTLWAGWLGWACWQGGMAIVLIWAISRLLPGLPARFRCTLWRLACLNFFGLAQVFGLIMLLWITPIGLPFLQAQRTRIAPANPTTTSTLPLEALDVANRTWEARLDSESKIQYASRVSDIGPRVKLLNLAVLYRRASSLLHTTSPTIARALLFLWLLGVGYGVITTMRQWLASCRLRRQCTPVNDPEVIAGYAELCAHLRVGRAPSLLVTDVECSPLLLGVRDPVIILPASLLMTNDAAWRSALAHELAHHKHHDLLWNWLPALTHVLFFFHPLVWLANREGQLAQEMAGDETAVVVAGCPVEEYATMLLQVAVRRCYAHRSLSVVSALGSYETLEKRLMALKSIRPFSARRLIAASTVLAMFGLIGIVPWQLVAAQPAARLSYRQRMDRRLKLHQPTAKEIKLAKAESRDRDTISDYIKDLNDAGYDHLTVAQLVKLDQYDIDPGYIKNLGYSGYNHLTVDQLIQLSTYDVDAGCIKDLKIAGYDHPTVDQLIKLRVRGVVRNGGNNKIIWCRTVENIWRKILHSNSTFIKNLPQLRKSGAIGSTVNPAAYSHSNFMKNLSQ